VFFISFEKLFRNEKLSGKWELICVFYIKENDLK